MEIEHLFNKKDIINFLKVRGMQWLHHLIRINNYRNTKKIYNLKLLGGRRSGGRHRKRWLWEVVKNVAPNQFTNYKLKGQIWQSILRDATIFHGLQCKSEMKKIKYWYCMLWVFLKLLSYNEFPYYRIILQFYLNIKLFLKNLFHLYI